MKVSIVGTGYVGLVTGVCLAEMGVDVICVDVDESKVRAIQGGVPPIFEADLEELLKRNLGDRLSATTDLGAAVADSELTFIAVGTPFDGRSIDLGAIGHVAEEIGAALRHKTGYHAVVVKSTVVPGTTSDVVQPLLEEASGKRAGVDFGVGVNPEFLTEGQAVHEFMFPDRLVLGGDARVQDLLEELYGGFPDTVPRIRMTATTAEVTKYASNALLATAISFANEIANLCSVLPEADVVDVMEGVHLSRYLSPSDGSGGSIRAPLSVYLEAGCGFGGSCLPKDVSALVAHAETLGREMPVLEAVLETNAGRADEVLALARRHVPQLAGARVTVLGLAFKPDTDDTREAPAIPIVLRLLDEGAIVRIHDPVVTVLPPALVEYADAIPVSSDLEASVHDAELIILVTRWSEYRVLPSLLAGLDPQPVFVDGRRMLGSHEVARYVGVGA
jgi:UDPglucose 6-dehydrogenase/GDP-mannose 6-dehydrogenase